MAKNNEMSNAEITAELAAEANPLPVQLTEKERVQATVRKVTERYENKFRSRYTDYTFNRTASWEDRDGNDIGSIKYNDALEVEGMTQINMIEPPMSNVEQNKMERQAFADLNNNGKIGRELRYYSDHNHKEAWVDIDAKVFWERWVA